MIVKFNAHPLLHQIRNWLDQRLSQFLTKNVKPQLRLEYWHFRLNFRHNRQYPHTLKHIVMEKKGHCRGTLGRQFTFTIVNLHIL